MCMCAGLIQTTRRVERLEVPPTHQKMNEAWLRLKGLPTTPLSDRRASDPHHQHGTRTGSTQSSLQFLREALLSELKLPKATLRAEIQGVHASTSASVHRAGGCFSCSLFVLGLVSPKSSIGTSDLAPPSAECRPNGAAPADSACKRELSMRGFTDSRNSVLFHLSLITCTVV